MNLYLVRHALPGIKGYDNRWPGPGLGPVGKLQAQWIESQFVNKRFNALWASDFIRTIETAEYVRKTNPRISLKTDLRLRERQAGGESHNSLVTRVHNWMEEKLEDLKARPTCIVAHGGSLNMILEYLDPTENNFSYPHLSSHGVKTPIGGIWEINLLTFQALLIQCPIQ